MSDESVGYYWAQAAKEREAMEQHDREHTGDPRQWWQDCQICADRIMNLEELVLDKAIENDAFPNK